MTRCMWTLALVAALALGACGGGGGDVAGAGSDSEETLLTNQQRIQEILQACAASSADELLALLEVLSPFLDPDGTGTPPGFTITGFNLVTGTIDWAIDVANDGSVDATGTAGFRTAADAPYVPLAALATLVPPLGAISNLPTVLAGLPDGTILRTSFSLTGNFTGAGNVDVSFTNPDGSSAVPSTSSGNVTISQPECTARISWAGVAVPDLAGGGLVYPNSVMTLEVQTNEDAVTGTITFDGTSTATIDAGLQGSDATQQLLLDLETGVLTPAP